MDDGFGADDFRPAAAAARKFASGNELAPGGPLSRRMDRRLHPGEHHTDSNLRWILLPEGISALVGTFGHG